MGHAETKAISGAAALAVWEIRNWKSGNPALTLAARGKVGTVRRR